MTASHLEVPGSLQREDLRTVYQALMTSRIDFRGRIWETIKTVALLFTGMLAATGGIAARQGTPWWILGGLGVVLMVLGGGLALWNHFNALREQTHQYHDEFSLYQIEKLLGLHNEIDPASQWLTGYEHLFTRTHIEARPSKNDLVEAWVQYRLKESMFVRYSRRFSWFLFAVSALFAVLLLLMAYYSYQGAGTASANG